MSNGRRGGGKGRKKRGKKNYGPPIVCPHCHHPIHEGGYCGVKVPHNFTKPGGSTKGFKPTRCGCLVCPTCHDRCEPNEKIFVIDGKKLCSYCLQAMVDAEGTKNDE